MKISSKIMDQITIKRNVLQGFFPKINFDKYTSDTDYKSKIEQMVQFGVGGFCVQHCEAASAPSIMEQLQTLAEIPLLFIGEISTGMSDLLPDGTDFPHIAALAQTQDLPTAFKIGKALGTEADNFGIKWLILRDCNTQNLLGEDEELRKFAIEIQRGIQSKKIITSQYYTNNAEPYHLPSSVFLTSYVENIGDSISDFLSKDVHREPLITEMQGDSYAEYKKLLLANITILICEITPTWLSDALARVIIEDTNLSEAIDDNHAKIIKLKRLCGLIPRFAKLEQHNSTFMSHQNMALKTALRACKIIDDKKILPLLEENHTTVFAFIDKDIDLRSATRFYTMLAQASDSTCDFAYIDTKISNDDIDDLHLQLSDSETTIYLLYYNDLLDTNQVKLISRIINGLTMKNCFVINFGNPQNTELICSHNSIITYSDSFPSLAAAVTILFGRQDAVENFY